MAVSLAGSAHRPGTVDEEGAVAGGGQLTGLPGSVGAGRWKQGKSEGKRSRVNQFRLNVLRARNLVRVSPSAVAVVAARPEYTKCNASGRQRESRAGLAGKSRRRGGGGIAAGCPSIFLMSLAPAFFTAATVLFDPVLGEHLRTGLTAVE